MGCSTKLWISSKWELRDIITVMENHISLEEQKVSKTRLNVSTGKKQRVTEKKKVIVESCHDTSPGMFTLHFKVILSEFEEMRMMYAHLNCDTPLGPCTLLSLGMNDEAISIMKSIAMVLGGYLEESDCECRGEMIEGGADNKGDGLVYFVTSGIKEGKFGNKQECFSDLGDYIKEWNEKVQR